jgi:peptide/nickel transport system substrate-binding protein
MLKKIRIWSWIVTAFIKKYALGLTIGSIIGIVLALNSEFIIKLLPVHSNQYIGRIGSFSISQIPLDIQQKISKGLTKIDSSGDWDLDAAAEITPSEDGLMYTVKLKPDLRWSNGEVLTSADFDLNIADVTIDRPDKQTIVFKLKESFAPFPTILSQPILKKIKVGLLSKKTQIIGLNPYVLQNVQTNNQKIKTISLKSTNNTLIYRFYSTEEEALVSFKMGRIDQIENITAPYLEDWRNISIVKNENSNRYLALFFNTANRDLQDKSIRQMLAYATPKKEDDTRIISPINKQSWSYNPQVKPYTQNMTTAKASFEKLKKANPQFSLSFTITTTPAYVDMAQRIIDSWQQLGIQAQLKIVPYPDTSDYEILLIGQQVPDDPDQYALWHSTQITNISHYQSPKIDKLLEDGRKQTNKEQRKETYQDFQRFLVEDSPVVFLNDLPMYTMTRGLPTTN